MALVPFPPTHAAFLAACSKPEAFTGNPLGVPVVPGIPVATIDTVLRRQADRVAVMALSDRATLPILTWGEEMEDAVCARAARMLMAFRGYNRQAGADEEIVKWAQEADEFLKGCAPGTEGKRYTPQFTDSKGVVTDGVRVISHRTSEEALLVRRGVC